MDTFSLVVVLGVGVIIGLYVSSQIMEHIDSNTRHKEFMKNLDKHGKDDERKK
tara:strand:- start:810 stop:968 length:159 start_codon:yes stop_codon:yes gene_type:complete